MSGGSRFAEVSNECKQCPPRDLNHLRYWRVTAALSSVLDWKGSVKLKGYIKDQKALVCPVGVNSSVTLRF